GVSIMVKSKLKQIMIPIFAMLCILFTVVFIKGNIYAVDVMAVTKSVPVKMYNPDVDTGFKLTNPVQNTVFNVSSYTSLDLEVNEGTIKNSKYNGVDAYSIKSSAISL